MKVLVTGSNGFVGSAVVPYLISKDIQVEGIERTLRKSNFPIHIIPDFEDANWKNTLKDTKAIIHLAARAHKMGEVTSKETDQLYIKANYGATMALADQAAAAGVKHFIFISSIAADAFDPTRKVSEANKARWGIYGRTKWQAEEALLSREYKEMRVSIMRPPLIYGPGVKGNMATLVKLSATPLPLPFACLNDKKSFIYVKNLADALYQLLINQPQQDDIYTVKDCDLGLADIISELRHAQNKSPLLIPVPGFLFNFMLKITGRDDLRQKLFGTQIVDDSKFNKVIKWKKPFNYKKGFQKMVDSCIFLTNI